MKNFKNLVPLRRFGRTELKIPILSIGGMRFQESWKDLQEKEITEESQINVEKIINDSSRKGLNHIETARQYGTSELQLGNAFKRLQTKNLIIQTKVSPKLNVDQFETELEKSFFNLKCEKIDLLSIHGINTSEHLHNTIRRGGCLDVVRKFQERGKVGSIGFSTHGNCNLIEETIKTDLFDYVNLHWYFIRRENEAALNAARKLDLGVFIISPTDKGGHLHSPSNKLIDLCNPYHPIVFNDLFCLRDSRVDTISVGLSKIEDLNIHLEAISYLDNANLIVDNIQQKLIKEAKDILGDRWYASCFEGLPSWQDTPGEMNLFVLLWLYNLVEAWDMKEFSRARYGLLGNAGHWFPGNNADQLDFSVSEKNLRDSLRDSPWVNEIPDILRNLREKIGGNSQQRLSIST